MKLNILLTTLFLMVQPTWLFAGVGGQTLQKNLSPRAEAVGAAYTALVDDVYAIYWNPAALSYMRQSELNVAYSSGLADDCYAQLCYASATDPFHTWGLGFLYYTSGPFEHIDAYGRSIQTYDTVKSDWLLSYANAYHLNSWWRFGFTLDLFHSNLLDAYNATTLACNVSNSFDFSSAFRLDMALKHLGIPLSYGEENDSIGLPGNSETYEALPLTFALGMSYNFFNPSVLPDHSLKLTAEMNKTLLQPYYVNAGLEYIYNHLLALRLGYWLNHENKALSTGVGVTYPVNPGSDLKLDYAYSFSSLLKNQHKIALSFLSQITDIRQEGAQIPPHLPAKPYGLSDFKVGLGVGRQFGTAGVNFEFSLDRYIGMFVGFGLPQLLYSELKASPPKLCVGGNFYLGDPAQGFRGKGSFSLSNGIVAYHDYYSSSYNSYDMFPELAAGFGFQWRIFEFLSWDLDLGVAMGTLSLSYSSTSYITFLPSINTGIMFHIPKLQ